MPLILVCHNCGKTIAKYEELAFPWPKVCPHCKAKLHDKPLKIEVRARG